MRFVTKIEKGKQKEFMFISKDGRSVWAFMKNDRWVTKYTTTNGSKRKPKKYRMAVGEVTEGRVLQTNLELSLPYTNSVLSETYNQLINL